MNTILIDTLAVGLPLALIRSLLDTFIVRNRNVTYDDMQFYKFVCYIAGVVCVLPPVFHALFGDVSSTGLLIGVIFGLFVSGNRYWWAVIPITLFSIYIEGL